MFINGSLLSSDKIKVIPLRRGALIIHGDDINEEDYYNSSYTEDTEVENNENEISEEKTMVMEDNDYAEEEEEVPTEIYSDPSDVEWLVDLMVQGQKEAEEEERSSKDIKNVEPIEKKPKKLAKK